MLTLYFYFCLSWNLQFLLTVLGFIKCQFIKNKQKKKTPITYVCVCVCVCVSQKHTSPKFDLISVHGASAEGEVKVVLDLCQSWVQQKGVSFPRRPSRRPSSTGRQVWFSPQWDHHFFPLGPDARQMLPVPPCFLQSWGGLAFKFRGPSKSLSINYHWFHSKCIQHAYKVLTLS